MDTPRHMEEFKVESVRQVLDRGYRGSGNARNPRPSRQPVSYPTGPNSPLRNLSSHAVSSSRRTSGLAQQRPDQQSLPQCLRHRR